MEYKQKLKNEFIDSIKDLKDKENYSLKDWDNDFNYVHGEDVEENSDYDSDNDIDPIDNFSTNFTKNVSEQMRSKRPIRIAIVGRQNSGKSSIVNSLLKENRVIVSDIPGTTRDSIPIEWVYKGRRVVLIDTAGLKAQNKDHSKVESMSSAATIQSIKYCHVVLYVIDSMLAFNTVDLKLINYIGEQGRGVVFIANKWDLVENGYKTKAKKWMEDQLESACTHYKGYKINFVSAKNFYKIDDILDNVLNTYTAWNKRISTNLLNKFVGELKKVTQTPGKDGEHLKLKFMTQIKTRPPAFTVFVNNIALFFKTHELFLKKMLAKEFGLKSVPVRFLVRDHKKIFQKNKYKKLTVAGAKIQQKIHLLKSKLSKPTYRRKVKGYEALYGKQSPYKGYKK
jgi:GTP-binding protein